MRKTKEKSIELPVFSSDGKEIGKEAANEKIFGQEVRPHLLHSAAEAYLVNQRQGTASTKTRSEKRGSTRKLYRQKGTGRARVGSSNSPTRIGGAVTFGPRPRDYRHKMPKKERRQALLGALSSRAAEGDIRIIESLSLEEISTKAFAQVIGSLGFEDALSAKKPLLLLITDTPDEVLILSAANIRGVALARAEDLNAYEVMKYKHLLMTKEGLARLQEVFA